MTKTDNIRYRADGSIDTQFYMDRARHLRSRQAHAMMQRSTPKPRKTPGMMHRIFG